jgi:hypothetical protein
VGWPKFSVRLTRDALVTGFAMAGIAYEVVANGGKNTTLLVGLIGLLVSPGVIRADQHRRDSESTKYDDTGEKGPPR